MKHPDLPDNKRREIALKMLEGSIFTTLHFPECEFREGNIIGLVFMPVLLGAFSEYTPEELDDVGFLWEDMSKGLSMAIRCL